ncbi:MULTISPECIES: S-adenosylmethionine decarboxylase related protein [unclassified Paenibacillus]|uniref:S-adenosylmethionine decarboxylase related protein n=1 Tax=Paenibacillus provencensis TaxID=441151 RepID=A0ABW3PML0_9BACL|nr:MULTISPECIES: S-adenosylmethionine decarboxylase related protein [unclassified Paenibacillus]MCM3129123.1 S-adenosylmethionine decarboxylase related protein [Paenibacillus sp. MER 78]SFS52082.1 Homospermidine synthase [Paenibacillus sp. 453mf]
MKNIKTVISILGSAGGVSRAILSILEKSYSDTNDPIHSYIHQCQIHLIDLQQKDKAYYASFMPQLLIHATLHQFDLTDLDKFQEHLDVTGTTHAIDVSWADSVDMLNCCQARGVAYINTALESPVIDELEILNGYTLLERYKQFMEGLSTISPYKAIIGSGMNPGVVQWMAIRLIQETPDIKPLACYIVEHDNTMYLDPSHIKEQTIYSTWSPECFLDEALINYPLYMKYKFPITMHAPVYELEFKVRLGAKQFYGSLMAHEEVLTLGKEFDMETGFIYRVSDYVIDTIRNNLENADDLWDWEHVVLDPADGELGGEDLVGVLLVYPDKERYMYNVLSSKEIYPIYHTNATYFQVACGIYGALCTLLKDDLPNGIYFIDELLLSTESLYGQYLTYYMENFVTGENTSTDGLLLDRMRKFRP